MSDSTPERPSSPPPARRPESVRDDRAPDEDAAPTPARALLGEAGEEHGQEPEEAVLEAGDERWTVRVSGRGRTGAATGAASLLLLSFRRQGADRPERESLVVGRALPELSEEQLLEALERGRKPAGPGPGKEIFPEVGGRKRGRDG